MTVCVKVQESGTGLMPMDIDLEDRKAIETAIGADSIYYYPCLINGMPVVCIIDDDSRLKYRPITVLTGKPHRIVFVGDVLVCKAHQICEDDITFDDMDKLDVSHIQNCMMQCVDDKWVLTDTYLTCWEELP